MFLEEKLMSSYILKGIHRFEKLDLDANYIVLFGVDKEPPHVGFVSMTKYFSKSSIGGKFDHDFNKVLKSVERKNIPTVIIKLEDGLYNPHQFYDKQPLKEGESCLSPIKSILFKKGKLPNELMYVFDIIAILKAEGRITKIEHLGCEQMLSQNCLTLNKYGQEEIDKAILDTKKPC